VLHMLTGVKLKMSTAYHPETDGSSKRSNKTVEQALCYHIDHNQKGWVKALPLIRFNMTPLTTPFPPQDFPDNVNMTNATTLINALALDTMQAQDNLLTAKVAQAEFANHHHGNEQPFAVGERVLLSMKHQHWEYMQANSDRVTKFMPQYDGPFVVTHAHPETSTYTLLLPNELNRFPTFHSSLLWKFSPTDYDLFPTRSLPQPGPVVTPGGQEEWVIRGIIDERPRGWGKQYLVHWVGWSEEENRWLAGREVAEAKVLDRWLAR
jgi:hypothetical protein